MKLNPDNNTKEILYQLYANEDNIISNYMQKHVEQDYEKILQQDSNIDTLLALSDIRKNIINWYPFRKDCTVLEIGAGLGEITGELCKKAKKVISIEPSKKRAEAIAKRHENQGNLQIVVQNLEDINLEEKVDYITLIGTIELIENLENKEEVIRSLFQKIKSFLKEDGVILLAMDNELGMNQFTSIKKDGQTDRKFFTVDKVLQILAGNEMTNKKNYYILPNYKLPNVIFTDEYLPNEESIGRDLIFVPENRYSTISEVTGYKKILKKDRNLFSIFSNSIFMEIFNDKYIENNIKFVSFSNIRKPEYRIKTVIKDKKVYKEAVNTKSEDHVKKIVKNINILNEAGMNTIDSDNEGRIVSEYQTNAETLDKVLIKQYNQSKDLFIATIQKFQNELMKKMQPGTKENNVFDKYQISYGEEIESFNFKKYGLWDLMFQNCFYVDEKFYFYDQEWMEENVPIEYIIYRSIKYLTQIEEDKNEIYQSLGIQEKHIELFEKLDNKMQEEIRDNIIWSFHIKQNKCVDEIEQLKKDKEKILEDCRKLLLEKDAKIQALEMQNQNIQDVQKELEEKKNIINQMANSKSWRITEPLRKIQNKMKR